MTPQYIFKPQARRDSVEIAVFIRQDNPAMAESFLAELEQTCANLVTRPETGHRFELEGTELQDVRAMRVSRIFSAYLIFYRQTKRGIEIIRVLHGDRDFPILFDS